MRRLLSMVLPLVLMASAAEMAAAEKLPLASARLPEAINIGVSSREIAIAPDFSGTDVTVFGALDNIDPYLLAIGSYDVVVALEGPRDFITVRKKERVFGVWVNRHSVTFEWMPESFSMASTRVIDQIGTPMELYTYNIGLPRAKIVPSTYSGRAEEVIEYRDAFLNLKHKSKLYQSNPGGVSFVSSSSLFQATIHIPADIPNGTHTIRAVAFKNGVYVAEKELKLHVVKTGLEQTITRAAEETPLYYGLFSVLLAVITGWGASIMFRKD
ncbi:TIGR02186 family protein [Rhizobium sp. KVB221]|uniref:TIGR02186 family protein n=1 Tax=Rhizobium setariae TaxID=2801340 RepID=A0A936YK62_9HYPH|nr:TIGR02186 family protein [Rhizobium setariae]MBL0371864.1 TIGR02186 family protein [Rhizobium setariae]